MSKRIFALIATSVTIGAALAAAPSAFAASQDPPTTPTVQSVALDSSSTPVTSSTKHKLVVRVNASQNVESPSIDSVSVTLATGTSETSELHDWSFPVDATALTVDSTGSGTLDVPSTAISPYGDISLTIAPIGSPSTQSCDGVTNSQTQDVSLKGTFFFDSKSTGAHMWGTVGSKTGSFTFAATNKLTWTYLGALPDSCGNPTKIPCASGLFWEAPVGALNFEGVASGNHGILFASRTAKLSTPTGATRDDESFATTKKLVLAKKGGGASLPVTASTNSSGSATLTGSKAGKPFSLQCQKSGKTVTETATTWENAKYTNAKKPLVVAEQVFGALKAPNNTSSSISQTTLS